MPTFNSILNYGLPIGTSLLGGVLGSNAVGNATGALTQGGQAAINTITGGQKNAQGILNTTVQQQQGLLNPFVQSGVAATGQLQNPDLTAPFTGNPNFSFTPADLANDPGYQFRLQNGLAAINAGAAASGDRFSGATLKALDQFAGGEASQEYQTAYQRAQQTFQQNFINAQNEFRQNQATKLAALQQQQQEGLSAAGTESGALGTFGINTTNLQVGTSKAVADLQTQIANATAAGDVAKANQLQGILNGITGGVGQAQTLNALKPGLPPSTTPTGLQPGNPAFVGPVQSAAGIGATGASLAAPTAIEGVGTGVGTAGLAAAGVPAEAIGPAASAALGAPAPLLESAIPTTLEGATAGGEAAVGAGAAEAGTAGGAGVLSSAASLLTNPITIGIGAAIAGAMIWKGTQTHPVADTFVKDYQNPFGQHLDQVVNQFDQALSSGQLTKADAQTARNATAQLIQQFETDGANFAKKGDKEASVWNQAERTMAEDFGGTVDKTGHNNQPDWSLVLGKMDREITALPG